jgi:hypothetical protein
MALARSLGRRCVWLRRPHAIEYVRLSFLAVAMLVSVPPGAVADEASVSREDQFKAAYLFNFLKFVEWPPSVPSDVLTVCFVGGSGVYEALGTGLDEKRAGARRLVLRRLKPAESAVDCNALYLEASASRDVRVATVSAAPILTVSDASAFATSGGMIELFADSNRLRFNINMGHAQRVGLRISSSLLQLAAAVEKEERP